MQHHGAILHNVEGAHRLIAEDFGWDDEVFLSFLPRATPMSIAAASIFPIGLGAQIYYSEGLEKLASNIEEVRPTIMVVVPRLFEVLRARILKQVEKQGRLAELSARPRARDRRQALSGQAPVWDKPMDLLLALTLRPKIRAKFGGRIKAMVSGGAPLNPEVGIFFHSLGLTLLQGYGQTEAGAGDQLQPAERRPQDGHGRPAAARNRGQDRRGRRDPGARRARHARLLAQRRGDRARAEATAGCTPATSAISTTRAGSSSPTARRT